MTFRDRYIALEREFYKQIEKDKNCGVESKLVHNIVPGEPVDFVLIGMEASTGGSGEGGQSTEDKGQIGRNFAWSTEDFILHHCIRNYLCQGDQTYYLTDLSKGSMTADKAGEGRQRRYETWYPLLKKELRLVAKPCNARVIAIGNEVERFLNKKKLCRRVEKIMHYSPQTVPHRRRAIEPWKDGFKAFCEEDHGEAFEETVRAVLQDADMDSYIFDRVNGRGNRSRLTKIRLMLMFYYKNRFEELRDSDDIILNLPTLDTAVQGNDR